MGKHNDIISREILISAIWLIEQKFILFWCRTDIHDESARPWRCLTANISNSLINTILKLSHTINTGLIIVLSNFDRDFFIDSEVIAFLTKTVFLPLLHTFLRITQEPLNIFKIWLSYVKGSSKTYQNHYSFYFKNKFYEVWIWVFRSNRPIFTLFFFGKSGQGGIIKDDSHSLSSNIISLVRNNIKLYLGSEVIS